MPLAGRLWAPPGNQMHHLVRWATRHLVLSSGCAPPRMPGRRIAYAHGVSAFFSIADPRLPDENNKDQHHFGHDDNTAGHAANGRLVGTEVAERRHRQQ